MADRLVEMQEDGTGVRFSAFGAQGEGALSWEGTPSYPSQMPATGVVADRRTSGVSYAIPQDGCLKREMVRRKALAFGSGLPDWIACRSVRLPSSAPSTGPRLRLVLFRPSSLPRARDRHPEGGDGLAAGSGSGQTDRA